VTAVRMTALTAREADIFRCFADTVVAPETPDARCPTPDTRGPRAVADTDAVAFFDDWLAHAPAPNRYGIRALLYALERAPLALGCRARLRRLTAEDRRAVLARLRATPLGGAIDAVASIAQLSYYGDDAVMRAHGYDAAALIARCRALRAEEDRW
jgi:hypothetical protein